MLRHRDRPLRTLELLGAAGDAGLLTTEIVKQAGEEVNQRTLTWFGSVLREAEQHSWVVRGERTAGGWQQGRIQRWHITPAGRQHALKIWAKRGERDEKAARKEMVAQRHAQALKDASRDYVRGGPIRGRQLMAVRMRDAGASYQEISDVTGVSRQQSRTDYLAGLVQWPAVPRKPRGRAELFGKDHPRWKMVTGAVADETGLEVWQAEAAVTAMLAMGMRVALPRDWRSRSGIETILVAVDTGTADELPSELVEWVKELIREPEGEKTDDAGRR